MPITPTFRRGDRVRHTLNGDHGTVANPRVWDGRLAKVDWDEKSVTMTNPQVCFLEPLEAEVTPITTEYEAESQNNDPASDPVAHPSHYTQGLYEVWRVIRDWKLNFNRGSAVKYIARAGKKDDELQDLRKARQFLDFEIEAIEAERKAAN